MTDDEQLLKEISKTGYRTYKKKFLLEWEASLITRLYMVANHNKSHLAEKLKMDRKNLIRLMKFLRLDDLIKLTPEQRTRCRPYGNGMHSKYFGDE